MNKTIYYHLKIQQVSVNNKDWLDITNYNQYSNPYWDINENKDWCSISSTLNGESWRCFVKEQGTLFENSKYYQAFVKKAEFPTNPIVFDCAEVKKNPVTGKWEKVQGKKEQDDDFFL